MQPAIKKKIVEVWDSLVLNQLRVFTGSLEEDLVFHRRSARYLRDFGSRKRSVTLLRGFHMVAELPQL